MYLLKRVEDGRFVAKSGREASYTRDIEHVRIYPTREAAEADRCVENEIIVPMEALSRDEVNEPRQIGGKRVWKK